MSLPPVSAAVVAQVMDDLPQRLRKRVDATLNRAADWILSTEDNTVRVDDDTTLTFTLHDGVLTAADDLTCTCLLPPKCLPRAIAVTVAPAVAVAAVAVEPVVSHSVDLSPQAVEAAGLLWQAGAAVL